MYQQYSYEEVLSASERFSWRVEDLIGGERRLDFSKPFLPDSLARTQGMTWLTPEQRRIANQIRGAGYLYMFGLVEEFILPFVLDHVRPQLDRGDSQVRAFLSFAAEEALIIPYITQHPSSYLSLWFFTHSHAIYIKPAAEKTKLFRLLDPDGGAVRVGPADTGRRKSPKNSEII